MKFIKEVLIKIFLIILLLVSSIGLGKIAFAGVLPVSSFIIPNNFQFNTTLVLSSTTIPDVSYLQNALNMDSRTQLTSGNGAGSNSHLTNYFGQITKKALHNFQVLYHDSIFVEYQKVNPRAKIYVPRPNTLDYYTRIILNNKLIQYRSNQITSANTTSNTNASDLLSNDLPSMINATQSNNDYNTSSNNQSVTFNTLGDNNTSNSSSNNQPNNNYSSSLYPNSSKTDNTYLNSTTTNTNTSTSSVSEAINLINNINSSNGSGSNNNGNGSNGKTKTSMDEQIYEKSPQGLMLKLIGGQSLVDKFYKLTPGGVLGGNLPGMGGGSSGSGGGSSSGGMAAGGLAGALGGGGSSSGGASGGIMSFGGPSTSMVTCTCSANLLIYVKDAKLGVLPLIYQPGATILYKMYRPTSGVNMLGRYVTGGQCLIYVGTGCSSGGTPMGTMVQLGTSLSI